MTNPIIPQKRCPKCGRILELTAENFYRNARNKSGFQCWCKVCFNESSRKWKRANPEKVLEGGRRQYRNNIEKRRETARKWKRANPEKVRESNHRWRQDNPDGLRRWRKNNPEKDRAVIHRRLARKRSLPDDFTPTDWLRCLKYFDNCCAVCGRPAGLWHTIAADHWIPLASPNCPGTIPMNIVPLCQGQNGCNNGKNAIVPTEWLQRKCPKRWRRILARIEAYFQWVKEQDGE